MRPLRVGLGVVAVADLLGEVLGDVPDALGGVLRPGQDALGVELDAEPGDVVGLVSELVERLVSAGQDFPAGRVEVVPGAWL
jgi:hypothetical protein